MDSSQTTESSDIPEPNRTESWLRQEIRMPRWSLAILGWFVAGLVLMVTSGCAIGILWVAFLSIGFFNFANQSNADRRTLHEEVEALRKSTKRIEESSKHVEQAVVPDMQK